MKILLLGKVPPIQGGVSRMTLATTLHLGIEGHEVLVLTNSNDVEGNYRQAFLEEDEAFLSSVSTGGVRIGNLARFVNVPECIHIPFSPAFESRLLGAGLSLVEEFKPDVIFGWYFQPYGVVASLLSEMTGIPYGIMHAGSDIGRLIHQPDLAPLHTRMLRRASFVFTGYDEMWKKKIIGLGARADRVHVVRTKNTIDAHVPELALERYSLARMGKKLVQPGYDESERTFLASTCDALDPALPLFTMYGKLGGVKGQLDFVKALARLSDAGHPFQFALNYAGSPRVKSAIRSILESNPRLRGKAFLLPMIPTWRIESLLAASTAVAFLENGFDVPHTPGIPFEIIRAGKPLILSRDIAKSAPFSFLLEPGVSMLDGGTPGTDDLLFDSLAWVLREREAARLLGLKGGIAYQVWHKSAIVESKLPSMADFFHGQTDSLRAERK